MKYVVILGDGMADYPLGELNGKTPLMVANKPFIDSLAGKSIMGLCKTIPDGMKPGSDVANLSVLGFEPDKNYTGRSPLEAASIGIDLTATDLTARANLVTLSDDADFNDKIMVDYSGGEISTEEAKLLINDLKKYIDDQKYTLYSGVSYRNCLVTKNGKVQGECTPPHDISGKRIGEYLPKNQAYLEMIKKSYEILKNHPVNLERIKNGKRPANALWFWGEGTKPNLEDFSEKFNIKGGMISAVDLLKGMAILSNMEVIEVEGATGIYTTNFLGKAEACLEALKTRLDFVYIHIEAPDECGHQGDVEHKIYSIEQIDKVVETIFNGLRQTGEDFRILICPDHPTPIQLKTHVSDPVPFIIYKSDREVKGIARYDEQMASDSGIYYDNGVMLMKELLN